MRLVPTSFSSCEMRLAMTDVTAFSSRAAPEMLPSRATRRNALMLRIVSTAFPSLLSSCADVGPRQLRGLICRLAGEASKLLPALAVALIHEGQNVAQSLAGVEHRSGDGRVAGQTDSRRVGDRVGLRDAFLADRGRQGFERTQLLFLVGSGEAGGGQLLREAQPGLLLQAEGEEDMAGGGARQRSLAADLKLQRQRLA